VYTAQQALDAKLVDRIGYMDDALDFTRKAIGVSEAKVVVYHRPSEYRATYYARAESSAGSLDVSVSRIVSMLGAGPGFFYLWWP
jgi:protease IV